jgi:hypothetical protein
LVGAPTINAGPIIIEQSATSFGACYVHTTWSEGQFDGYQRDFPLSHTDREVLGHAWQLMTTDAGGFLSEVGGEAYLARIIRA